MAGKMRGTAIGMKGDAPFRDELRGFLCDVYDRIAALRPVIIGPRTHANRQQAVVGSDERGRREGQLIEVQRP